MFMENMWEFSICFFAPYRVNIPMYAGEFKQVQYKEYICWMQVKIYISEFRLNLSEDLQQCTAWRNWFIGIYFKV